MRLGPYLLHICQTLERDGSVCLIRVAGEVDAASSGQFRAALEQQVELGRDVVVDLAEVSFMDAAGIGALVEAERSAARAGHRVRARNASGIVARVLRITETDWILLGPD